MASDGQLVFPNFDTAINFINNTLVKSISKFELQWNNIRIDPLNSTSASIAAIFHEDITNSIGEKKPYNGYFTGIAHQTSQGWKLRNAHWSIIKNNIVPGWLLLQLVCRRQVCRTLYGKLYRHLPSSYEKHFSKIFKSA